MAKGHKTKSRHFASDSRQIIRPRASLVTATRRVRSVQSYIQPVTLLQTEDLRSVPNEIRQGNNFRDVFGGPAEFFRRSDRRQVSRLLPAMYNYFQQPKEALVCVRRKVRKAVLFAMRHAGGSGNRRPRWTSKSFVRC